MADDRRAVILWKPPRERDEFLAEERRKRELAETRRAELEARRAQAERRKRQADIHEASERLVLCQLQKLLEQAQSPDFRESLGPMELRDLIKLAELASKEFRLDTGKSTANVAHAVAPSIDFSKMTPEQREEWRRLALIGGGGDVEG